jgi:hypothetical protein
VGQSGARKIRASAAGYDRADPVRLSGGRNQGGTASGTRAKVPDRQLTDGGIVVAPVRRVHQTIREHSDIESELTSTTVYAFLIFRQQIHEECGQRAGIQLACYVFVARASPDAATAVSEDYEACRVLWNSQVSVEAERRNTDGASCPAL